MNPSELPMVGTITNPDKDIYGRFTNLENKKLLCIGFSELEIDSLIKVYNPKSITVLTNWEDHVDARIAKYPIVIGDITRRTKFEEDSFDVICTLSVLEHLCDLPGAFDEMSRILRNEGEMVHMFGPVWSSAYGHHIYENPKDPLLNFSKWKMPAHMHLLCNRDEIIKYYVRKGYPQSAGLAALHWFYETPLINRIFYDEYLKIMNEDRFLVDRLEMMYNKLTPDHLMKLRKLYPGMRDFSTYGAKIKLILMK
jgi:SAM-dependent methyltransferase